MLIDELIPSENYLDKVNLKKFLSEYDYTFTDRSKPKGPNYFIIDNFARYFKLDNADLLGAKTEVKKFSEIACDDPEVEISDRCDTLLWLEKIDTQNGKGMTALNKITK